MPSSCNSRYTADSMASAYVGAIYIRFSIIFTSFEIGLGGVSGEFVHLYHNQDLPLFGLAYDYDNSQWNVNIDRGSVVKTIDSVVVSGTPYQIDFKLYNIGQALPTNLNTVINNVYYPDATAEVYHGDLQVTKAFVGSIGATQRSDRRIFNFTIGTHPAGNASVFNGKLTGTTIVPPFVARQGSTVAADTGGLIRIQTATAIDAYAIAEFPPQVF